MALAAVTVALVATQAHQSAWGTVRTSGQVVPADNLFTPNIVEGLPFDGNLIIAQTNDDGDPVRQVLYEGRFDPGSDLIDPSDDTNIVGEDIIVGSTSVGTLEIDGESVLRFQDLIIGDSGMDEGESDGGVGTGFVRISGFRSTYNNDPNILPAEISAHFTPEEWGAFVLNSRDSGGEGFDLYVGRAGNGTLVLSEGGRAEIQDAAIIGDMSGSNGIVTVDGFSSFLGSGGFEAEGGTGSVGHTMYVGRFGNGRLKIMNGGTVFSKAPTAQGGNLLFGASIGSEVSEAIDQTPRAGGFGKAVVDGSESSWFVTGGLQVGGFHDGEDAASSNIDVEGDDLLYDDNVGVGELHVVNGGLVSIADAVADEVPTTANSGRLLIGLYGHLILDGGNVVVGTSFAGSGGNAEDGERRASQRLYNDGTITGTGNIDTGYFNNRLLGVVSVGLGQRLAVTATGSFPATPSDFAAANPLSNYGLIEVKGGEFEALRGADLPNDSTPGPTEPFRNLTITTGTGAGSAGRIVGQDATFRFRSGLSNRGVVAFTAGQGNIVTGDVVNEAESDPMMMTGDEGRIVIAGDETFVTFENDLTNMGTIDLTPDATGFTVLGNFMNTGSVSIALGGGESGSENSYISVGDDATLAGTLQVSLFNSGPNPLMPMAGDTFEILSAAGDVIGNFDTLISPPELTPMMLDMISIADPVADVVFLEVFSFGGAVGADFNGDGIVDNTDFLIWFQNLGNPGGPGDANGDGLVDGQDYLLWQLQFGGPGMGAGSGSQVASVPEPASASLLAGCLAGLVVASRCRRRRAA